MSPSYSLLVAAIVLSVGIECQAKPLSFGGVQLGQKWGPFLKAHPKAEVFSLGFDVSPLTKAQQLAIEGMKKEAGLWETRKGEPFPNTAHFFMRARFRSLYFLLNLVREEREG